MRVSGWDHIHSCNYGCTACTTMFATNSGEDVDLVIREWGVSCAHEKVLRTLEIVNHFGSF